MWNIRYTYHMMINIPSLETHRVVVVVVLVQLCCLTTFLQSTNVKTVSVNIWEPPSLPTPPSPCMETRGRVRWGGALRVLYYYYSYDARYLPTLGNMLLKHAVS